MGRNALIDKAALLQSATRISSEVGPQNLTIAALAASAGASTGSIYHRYASRNEILAAVWLCLVEEFQAQFLQELSAEDPVAAGLGAVRFTCQWVRGHPREARLLLLHSREDFAADGWPASYRERAAALTEAAAQAINGFAVRLAGASHGAAVRGIQLALIDLPTAALRRDVEAGMTPEPELEAMLLETCAFALRRIWQRHFGS
ncbi:MAG: TetR family transcriptional regulator [Candidatus Schekmanbacteria bacterium]|nr:TetR family transcriptional regulator [Candidatus Schekmanbacteria bacterium]